MPLIAGLNSVSENSGSDFNHVGLRELGYNDPAIDRDITVGSGPWIIVEGTMELPEMRYRSLGRCGTKVSVFGLGGWLTFGHQIADERTAQTILKAAFDAGVSFFDTADVYAKGRSEQVMGKYLHELPRHELVIASKVFFPMSDEINDCSLSRKHIMESVEKSLQRMGIDYLDIYFCHRHDENTPLEETARAMDDLVHQGKILYWGTSEWSSRQLSDVHELCREEYLYCPQVEQPQYNLLQRGKFESNVRPALDRLGMGAVCWSPLAMGVLTGKYDRGLVQGSRMDQEEWLREERYTEENLERVRQFKRYADRMECTRAQLALAWVAAQPGVSSVILGANRPEQLEENLAALAIQITPELDEDLKNLFPAQ